MAVVGCTHSKCFICLLLAVSAHYLWSERDTATILIIGSPGHGKSTFLNAMAKDRKAFEVAASGDSCTKEVSNKTFDVIVGEGKKKRNLKLVLVDSPGFPDPEAGKAVEFYDAVVRAARQPLNAIVWLVKQERSVHAVMKQYEVLLREFNVATPPIILFVNGQENYEDDDEKQDRIEADTQDAQLFGQACARAAGLSVAQMFVSTTKPDMKKVAQDIFLAALASEPKASDLKTYEELEAEASACKDEAARVKLEISKIDEAIHKAQSSISTSQRYLNLIQNSQVATSAIAAGALALGPAGQFVTVIGSIALAFAEKNSNKHITHLKQLVDAKIKEKADLEAADPKEVAGNLEARLLELRKALTGS